MRRSSIRYAGGFLLALLGAISLALLPRPTTAAAAGTEQITSYAVGLQVRSDGTLHVRETIRYDFGGNQRHGIFRDIPTTFRYDDSHDRIYRVHNVRVTSPDGAPTNTKVSDNGGQTEIRIGDPNNTISGVHTYVLDYDVDGALNAFPDHVELYWNAVGTGFTVPIQSASVQLTAPAPITKVACFEGPQGSNLPCPQPTVNGTTARWSATGLGPNEGITVVAALPAGSVPAKPILRERFSIGRAFAVTPATAAGLLGVLALGGAGVGYLLWTRGRDRRYVDQILGLAPAPGQQVLEQHRPLFHKPDGAVEFAPPDKIRPGQVGTIIDEQANVVDVIATIIDLAVRGYLHITELPREGRFASRDWELKFLKAPDAELLGYERALFDALFSGRPDTVRLSELKDTFADNLADVRSRLYDDAVAQGWFTQRPDTTRSVWTIGGLVLAAAGAGLTFLLARSTHAALVGLGVVVVGLVMAFCGRYMPARTGTGSAVLARVLGFRQYIRTAEAEQLRFEEREQIFSRYLPYAMVFGETDRWAKAFASLATGPRADGGGAGANGLYWYSGPSAWNLLFFSESMSSFATTTAGVLASTPAASGSSGFSSGGGFSGGGGGGGGGGSW